MQCPECGHNVANGRTECIYCGAALVGVPFGEGSGFSKKDQMARFSRQDGEDGTVYEIIEERREYSSLDDFPEDWRKNIEKVIQQGVEDADPDSSIDIFSVFSEVKTPRRARLHPLILALIFFASAGVVGLIFWLLG